VTALDVHLLCSRVDVRWGPGGICEKEPGRASPVHSVLTYYKTDSVYVVKKTIWGIECTDLVDECSDSFGCASHAGISEWF
jgi:hypothetical protein